jgi:hypothetical protein
LRLYENLELLHVMIASVSDKGGEVHV